MKLFEITIRPETGFGSLLKGDTIFGHFCWQANYDSSLLNGGLDKWVSLYEKAPFAVFSSAWPKFSNDRPLYAFKKPDIPLECFYDSRDEKDRRARHVNFKEAKQKKWILVGEDLKIDIKSAKLATDSELALLGQRQLTCGTRERLRISGTRHLMSVFEQPHNTINRLTGTTGEGMFAPFSESAMHYYPETKLAIFVWIHSEATDIHRVYKGIERIGQFGYGKNASTGLGRFGVIDCTQINPPPSDFSPNACYMMGPIVPESRNYKELFFSPFIRFGKHGDVLARSAKPFKNPIIMADEGAVLVPKDSETFGRDFLGKAVLGTSKALPQSVAQGYSLFLPFRLEMPK